jgi:putative lipoprotein
MPSQPWWLLLFLLSAGCSTGTDSQRYRGDYTFVTAKVTGTVTYRERMALTPDAVVEVQLLDVSLTDVAATLIAEQTIKPEHQVPIPFEISFDPAEIDERMSYSVRATIRSGGRTMFITDRSYPVLTRGHPAHVDLVLVRSN